MVTHKDINLVSRRVLGKYAGDGEKQNSSLGTQEHEFPGEYGTVRMMLEENTVVTYDEECLLLPNLVGSQHHRWSKTLAPFRSMKMSS